MAEVSKVCGLAVYIWFHKDISDFNIQNSSLQKLKSSRLSCPGLVSKQPNINIFWNFRLARVGVFFSGFNFGIAGVQELEPTGFSGILWFQSSIPDVNTQIQICRG